MHSFDKDMILATRWYPFKTGHPVLCSYPPDPDFSDQYCQKHDQWHELGLQIHDDLVYFVFLFHSPGDGSA